MAITNVTGISSIPINYGTTMADTISTANTITFNRPSNNTIFNVDDIHFTDGSTLTNRLKAIEDRLSILVPDPKLHEQYESLREAYEHYKLMEALLLNPKE